MMRYVQIVNLTQSGLVLKLLIKIDPLYVHNGPYAKLFKIINSRGLGAQCSKHASVLLISERAKRASSVMFVFNRDYMWPYVNLYAHARISLLRNGLSN